MQLFAVVAVEIFNYKNIVLDVLNVWVKLLILYVVQTYSAQEISVFKLKDDIENPLDLELREIYPSSDTSHVYSVN